jgi:type IV pilus secretin PilQ/predicted competence protein
MRILWRALGLGALLAAGLVWTNGALRAGDLPVVHVKAEVKDGAVRLQADANAPFEYTTYRPSASLYVLDLSGVSAGDPAGARVVASDLVKSYRVITYSSGAKPVVRLEILLAQGVEPKLERQGAQDLTLLVSRAAIGASTVSSVPSPAKAALVPVSTKGSDVTLTAHESIRQVHLVQNGAATEVNISGSGPLTYHSIHLQNPDRLVLDFAGSHLTTTEKQIASNLDPVREIRLAQFSPEVSRVVIDLREPARYSIKGEGSTVTVSFEAKPAAATGTISAPSADSASNLTTKSDASVQSVATELAASAKPAEVPAPAAVLPAALTQTSSALATPAFTQPQQQTLAPTRAAIETASNPNATPAAAPVAAPVAAPAPISAQPMAASSPMAQTPGASSTAPAGKYSGEPISVNLKDVDLRDFFRLIHEISGLNVVVDPGVKGNLTIVLDDVPWDQALDIVLKNNDLDKQLDGNVLRLATKETLRKEADENRDLAKAVAESAEVVTTTRVLSYAKATGMVTTLKKFLSSRGDIIADDRSNTLIIRDIPSTLPVMDNLIRQLDRKSQQVEIEARVVAANRSFSREIGSQFAFSGAANTLHNSNVVGGAAGPSPITRTPPPPLVAPGSTSSSSGSAMPLISNLPAAVPTSGISYLFTSANFALDSIITAAEERGVGKLLSKPKIITQNNEKATVKQGTKIPVQTIVNNTVSVQFVDAVLELDVTPQITADGTIYMDVNVENDQIDGSIPRVQGIPAIDTQEAETKVTVNDGATVVIGGIIVTQQTTDVQQVPLVGSVPILGNLFKHTTVKSTSQELLFFLTPRILPS